MSKNILLTESQYKKYITYLYGEKILTEGAGNEYEFPAKLYRVKKYLDDNFVKTTILGNGDYNLPTKKFRCAIAKNDLQSKEPKKYFDQQLFFILQTEFKNLFNKENRDDLLKQIIDKWFRGKIKVFGTGCAAIEP